MNPVTPMHKLAVAFLALFASFSAAGCGSAVRVIVPAYFHGRLVVHCTSTGSNEAPLHADTNGVADGPCPSVQTSVLVFRNSTPTAILRQPGWTSTRDGIPTSIHIQVD